MCNTRICEVEMRGGGVWWTLDESREKANRLGNAFHVLCAQLWQSVRMCLIVKCAASVPVRVNNKTTAKEQGLLF